LEQITNMITQKPELLGLVFSAVGAIILIGAICKWEWVIGADTTGNKVKTGLIGLIVYKLFGRRVFFILTGATVLIAGIVWFIALGNMA